MNKTNEPTLASELLALMQARELARTDEEAQSLTYLLDLALDSAGARVSSFLIGETQSPWAEIMRAVMGSVAERSFDRPYSLEPMDGVEVLCIRLAHAMEFLYESAHLRYLWNSLPLTARSDRRLKTMLTRAGVLLLDSKGRVLEVERTVNGKRVGHMVCIPLPRLKSFLAGEEPAVD